ncbi:MAG TPA: hypothetical protein VHK88_13355 [Aquihabitans sp.]|nr:hypothetical protein [Aquihabitans sp.]
MGLEWTTANLSDVSLAGFDGPMYVAQVVRYDVPRGWVGYIHGHRVPGGPWKRSTQACRAVEVELDRRALATS